MLNSARMIRCIARSLPGEELAALRERVREIAPGLDERLSAPVEASVPTGELTNEEFMGELARRLGDIAENDGFKARVQELMREKGLRDKDVYDAIRMGKSAWYSHLGRKVGSMSEHTGRRNLFALCFVLRLTYYEAVWFLGCSGIQFSQTPLDLTVARCLALGIYEPDAVAGLMREAGLEPLEFASVRVRDEGPGDEDALLNAILAALTEGQIERAKEALRGDDLELYAPFCELVRARTGTPVEIPSEIETGEKRAEAAQSLARRIRMIAARKGIRLIQMYADIGVDNRYFMRRGNEHMGSDGILRDRDRLMLFRLCFGLRLSYEEAIDFLRPMGITFSNAAMDRAVAELLKRGIYDPVDVDAVIFDGGLPPLLSEE